MAKAKPKDGEVEAPKKGKGKLIIIAAALLLLGGGGGAAAYFMGLFGSGGEASASEHGEAEGAAGEAAASDHGKPEESGSEAEGGEHGTPEGGEGGEKSGVKLGFAFIDMPDLLVNLQPEGKRMHFLRLRLTLEVDNKSEATVKALIPRVLDSFQLYLRSLAIDEVQGSEGMQKLKEEMLARVNISIEPHRIRDVLFKEILVQ